MVITGLVHYSQSFPIIYQLCCKDGCIAGPYSRGELRPQEHVMTKSMWINLAEMERSTAKALLPLQAHGRFRPICVKKGL